MKSAVIILTLLAVVTTVQAQAPVATIALAPDQIGVVMTTQGITTRISFPDPVQEIICGDLYDATSGKGSFVVQRSGSDVFVKPIASKGLSNLFVKTGENGDRTYNFDLHIVSTAVQAHRVVNVLLLPGNEKAGNTGGQSAEKTSADQIKDKIQQAEVEAAEIVRTARQQAKRLIADADVRILEMDRQAAQRAQHEVDRRFVQALMLGVRETKISNPKVVSKKVMLALEPRILTLGERSYLRYTIQNNGDKEFIFGTLSLVIGVGTERRPLTFEVVQSKTENRLEPGESMAGVVVFDAKLVGQREKLTFSLRGEDSVEIANVSIQ